MLLIWFHRIDLKWSIRNQLQFDSYIGVRYNLIIYYLLNKICFILSYLENVCVCVCVTEREWGVTVFVELSGTSEGKQNTQNKW